MSPPPGSLFDPSCHFIPPLARAKSPAHITLLILPTPPGCVPWAILASLRLSLFPGEMRAEKGGGEIKWEEIHHNGKP